MIVCHISFFVYTFCRLLWFSQILNMTIQDFENIHFYHKITAEVFEFCFFWKVSKNIGFHRNYLKWTMQIVYGYGTQSWYTRFQSQRHLFIRYAQFIHFMPFLLSKIVFYGVQKLKGKRVLRKIGIIHVQHIVSSVAQKRNSMDFSKSSNRFAILSKVLYLKSRIATPQVIRIFKN